MRTSRRTIPFVPPLDPGALWRAPRRFDSFLGSLPRRTRYYYLARNAIWHGLAASGLAPGCAVLMPAYHHGVEVEVVLSRGLVPRFYRVDRRMRADLDDVRAQAEGARALYVTHYLGFPQDLPALAAIARERSLLLVEDCALSLFSRDAHGPLGSSGDMSIFCLYKTLPVPHGGMLALRRPEWALPPEPETPDRASTLAYLANRSLDALALASGGWGGDRLVASARSAARRAKHAARVMTVAVDTEHFEPSRVSLGISSAARAILDRTDPARVVARRRENFLHLAARLDPDVRSVFPGLPAGVCPLSYPILVEDKESLQEKLLERGLETVNFWSRSHPAAPAERFPDVTFLRRHVLEIPVHQSLRSSHMEWIASALHETARWGTR